ncbi:MAG: penicillin-binding protein 2, partial [Croceibacterium sp.]
MAKLTPSSLNQSFERRTFVIGAIQGGLGLLLAARMGYIAVAENAKYEMESESNRVNLSLIPPRRGWILDRNGAPLASNQADFRVDIIPERLKDPEREVATVGQLLALKPDQVADLNNRIENAARFQAVPVA